MEKNLFETNDGKYSTLISLLTKKTVKTMKISL